MPRVRAILLVFVCLLYVASWPGSVLRPLILEVTAPEVPKDIEGRDGALDVVVRAADGAKEPLRGARVRAFAMLAGRAHSAGDAITDDEGVARLASLPHADHWIIAEAPGRARASQLVVIAQGARRLDLELGKEHFVDVAVKTEQGEAVPGAQIEVRGASPFPVGALADANGAARIGRLGEGPYVVTVRAKGFEDVTRRRVPEGAITITVGRQGALVVTVLGEDGNRVAGARVLVASPSLWPARAAETKEDGTVRVAGLDSGSYSMRAQKGALVSPIEIGVAVARGEEKAIELRLVQGMSIAVHVVDASGDDDVPKARVTLAENGLSPFPLEGVTDKKGVVVLGPVSRGPVTLSARADGFVAKPALRVDDAPSGEVKIPLLRGGILVGKVRDSRGYAVDGATIRVVGTDIDGMPIDEDPLRMSFREAHFAAALSGPSSLVPAGDLGVMPGPVPPIPHGASLGLALGSGSSSGNAASLTPLATPEAWVTARDGTFRAEPVTPGRVRAYVHHPQYVEAMSELVVLAPDKEARVEVVLQRGGVLEGKVVDARGRAVAGAHVTVLATKGSLEHTVKTDSDGTFAFASVPEALTVLVSRDQDVTAVVARAEVKVPEGGKRSIEIAIPEARPPLPVSVKSGREWIEAAQVSAVSLDPAEALRVTAFTDARGETELANAKGLPLRVEIRAPGLAPRVMITAPETAKLDVDLPVAESVVGEVRTKHRSPIALAEIALEMETGVRHAVTNKDGAFTVTEASPGPAKLRVRAKGYAPVTKELAVESRSGRRPTDAKRIELAEEGIVEGIVVDGGGDPVAGARVARDAVPTYLPVGVALPTGIAQTDAKGRFRLAELPEGTLVLEAYAADVGRARVANVRVSAGRTTDRVKIVLVREEKAPDEPLATGGVAITLGETAAGLEAPEVVVVAVAEGSEAERAGLAPNDIVLEVGGAKPSTIVEARGKLSGPVHDDVIVKVRRGERVLTLRVARERVRR